MTEMELHQCHYRRAYSKPEGVQHHEILGVQIPEECVVISQRMRRALDPESVALEPNSNQIIGENRQTRAVSTGGLTPSKFKALKTRPPEHSERFLNRYKDSKHLNGSENFVEDDTVHKTVKKKIKPNDNNSENERLSTIQQLKEFSQDISTRICADCNSSLASGQCICKSLNVSRSVSLTPREKAMHGRYLIKESLAEGAYGQICLANLLASNTEVVVKIVPKFILRSNDEKQSVMREEVIHLSCDHPNIIKLIETFQDETAHYFILERAENGTLVKVMTRKGLPEDQCRLYFKQVLRGLEYLHEHKIVHHDLKPQNILVHHHDVIKICDFGAARAYNNNEKGLPFAGLYGTPGYIAPELLLGEPMYTSAVDMFSAGLLLFELVFAYSAFYPPSACVRDEIAFPPVKQCHGSEQVKELISLLLVKDPEKRITANDALLHPWFNVDKK